MTIPACSITPEFPFGFSFQTFMKNGILVLGDGPVSEAHIFLSNNHQNSFRTVKFAKERKNRIFSVENKHKELITSFFE